MKKAFIYESDYANWLDFSEMFENVVTYGNKDYKDINHDEEHWEAFHNMYEDASYLDKDEFINNGDCNYTPLQLATIWDMFDNYDWAENRSAETIIPYMFPNEKFKFVTLCGYCQRDWEYAMLVNEDINIDTNIISDYFFGNVCEVKIVDEDDEYWDDITDSELYNATKEELLTRFCVDEIVKMKSKMVKTYEEVEF